MSLYVPLCYVLAALSALTTVNNCRNRSADSGNLARFSGPTCGFHVAVKFGSVLGMKPETGGVTATPRGAALGMLRCIVR
jgi:hypothetical protein